MSEYVDCPRCAGARFLADRSDPQAVKMVACPCAAQAPEAQASRLQRSGLDAYAGKTFATVVAYNAEMRRAAGLAQSYAQTPDGWLFIAGAPGCGKTHLAAAVGHYTLTQGKAVMFYTIAGMLAYLKAAFDRSKYDDDTPTLAQRVALVQQCAMLIIDDLGTEKQTSWVQEKMFELLDWRYARRMPTVITSNLTLAQLHRQYDSRLASRIGDRVANTHIIIAAGDYRALNATQRAGRAA